MKRKEKWMVALDLRRDTGSLMQQVAFLAKTWLPSEIIFTYVQMQLEIPKEVLSDIPDLQVPDTKGYEQKLKQLVSETFDAEQKVDIHILTGSPLTQMLKLASQKNVDLICMGRTDINKVGVLAQKMVRKAPCSVMLIPPRKSFEINSVIVPVDFSEYSDLALSMLNMMEEDTSGLQIHALHVYKDASKYLDQVFETIDEINEILSKRTVINKQLEKYAQHALEDYLKKKGKSSVQKHIAAVERGQRISEPIDKLIDQLNTDLVIIGSKGKSMSAASLLGEVSENVFKNSGQHIALVLKQKGENQSFLKSLLGLTG